MKPSLPSIPPAVQLALRCKRPEFVVVSVVSAKSPIIERGVWQLSIAFLRLLEDSGAPGDWRVANLVFWLTLGEVGELPRPAILSINDICSWTGHSAGSVKRHLKRLIQLGFVARRRRSRLP